MQMNIDANTNTDTTSANISNPNVIVETIESIETKNNNDNKYDSNIVITKKFTSSKWNAIEKPLSEMDRKRNEIVLKLGEDIIMTSNESAKTNLMVIGDYYYNIVKKGLTGIINFELINNSTTDSDLKSNLDSNQNVETNSKNKDGKDKKKKKEKEPKISNTVKTKLNNAQDVIDKKLINLKKMLEDNPEKKLYSDLMANFNYIEFRIIVLMKIIQFYIGLKKTEKSDIEELILGSKKVLSLLKNIKANKSGEFSNYFKKICQIENFDISLSGEMILDFEHIINQLVIKFGIKLISIANTRPKLIYDTKYDETIPNMKLKPYDSQIALAEFVKNNIGNGFMIYYKTLPGLGKTSMILSICSYIKKSNSGLKVIFCCSDLLESVRVQVLRNVFNFQIKFGIATSSTKDDKYIITNSWNCTKDDERELIVSDYKSTYLILKEAKHKYLLFFDEPTVMTDQIENTSTLNYLSLILYHLPSHIILSSATLPTLNEVEPITNHYISKYPDGKITEIVSGKTLIGCFIKDFNSNIIVPHSWCKNFQDLSNVINKISTFPLLGKFYTLPFLMNLNKFCLKYECGIDLDSVETFDQDNVLENIILLLKSLINLNKPEIFNEFIEIKVVDIQEDIFDMERLDIEYGKVVPKKFLTSHAFKYLGCCLIATSNPLKYVETHMYPIIEKLKEKANIKSIHKKYEFYLAEMVKHNENIEKIKAKFTSDDKIDEEMAKLKMPTFEFPNSLEINTYNHIKSFAKYVKTYDPSMLKNNVKYESINVTEFNIDDNLKFLLYMGVGIFSKSMDPDYTNVVLEMLQDRELAYIIADESFCYGANYLISNVIVTDDISDSHSINTILQLIGRTSRNGKSWSGKVYLDTNTSKRIKDFFTNPSFSSIEGYNIRTFFEKTKLECDTEIEIKRQELEIKNKEIAIKQQEKLLADAKALELNSQSESGSKGIRIIKDDTPYTINTIETNENAGSNDIFGWKRGANRKPTLTISSENTPNDTPNDTPRYTPSDARSIASNYTNRDVSNYTPRHTPYESPYDTPRHTPRHTPRDSPYDTYNTSSYPINNSQQNSSNEWTGIRGKTKTSNSNLFVPKSFEELKVNKSQSSNELGELNKSNSNSNSCPKPSQKINSMSNSISNPNLNPMSNSQFNKEYEKINDTVFFKKNKSFEQKSNDNENKSNKNDKSNKSDKIDKPDKPIEPNKSNGDSSGWVRGSKKK